MNVTASFCSLEELGVDVSLDTRLAAFSSHVTHMHTLPNAELWQMNAYKSSARKGLGLACVLSAAVLLSCEREWLRRFGCIVAGLSWFLYEAFKASSYSRFKCAHIQEMDRFLEYECLRQPLLDWTNRWVACASPLTMDGEDANKERVLLCKKGQCVANQLLPSYGVYINLLAAAIGIHGDWLSRNCISADAYEAFQMTNTFMYVKRITRSENTEIYACGDIHGDMQALNYYFQDLHAKGVLSKEGILKKNAVLIFCGDFVDRGLHGIEVMISLLRLKIQNPDQVELVRGNHEDSDGSLLFTYREGPKHEGYNSFALQLIQRFSLPENSGLPRADNTVFQKLKTDRANVKETQLLFTLLGNFYGSLPVALLLRTKNKQLARMSSHILFSHGCGIEPACPLDEIITSDREDAGYIFTMQNIRSRQAHYDAYISSTPGDTVAREIQSKGDHFLYTDFTEKSFKPSKIGYIWGECSAAQYCSFSEQTHLQYGTKYIKKSLHPNICAIICGHQHGRFRDPISNRLRVYGMSRVPLAISSTHDGSGIMNRVPPYWEHNNEWVSTGILPVATVYEQGVMQSWLPVCAACPYLVTHVLTRIYNYTPNNFVSYLQLMQKYDGDAFQLRQVRCGGMGDV